ncbi:MAG: cyclophilin-like fold protein [Candidatus Bathyarchaeota archaeon]|nr:cyclophilin-like fold protein [Candidatus Bathyarchaeota archaeon]
MSNKIKIYTSSTGYIEAEINDEKNPVTAKAILNALPFESSANVWGDEVYFDIPATIHEENSQKEVEIGDLGYWPAGSCFCIFYGRTPASSGDKPVAASPVNVFGKIIGDPLVFRKTKSGEAIRVEKA